MFDPYHKWLGIPKKYRPPTLYQLLGVEQEEQDREVIEEAAIRQSAHLRTYQIGPQAEMCTRLLNEIAQARLTLLDPAKRKKYDAELAKKAGPVPQPNAIQPVAAAMTTNSAFADLDITPPLLNKHQSRVVHRSSGKKNNVLVIGLVIGAVLFLLGILVPVLLISFVIFGKGTVDPVPRETDFVEPLPKIKNGPPEGGQLVQPPPKKSKPPDNPNLTPVAAGQAQPLTPDQKFEAFPDLATLRLAPHSSTALLGGSQVYLWDLKTGKPGIRFPGRRGGVLLAALAVSPDGTLGASSITDEEDIHLWNLQTGQEVGLLKGHSKKVYRVVFLPDGQRLLSAGEDNTVRLWEVAGGKELKSFIGHNSAVRGLAVSADGRRAVSSEVKGNVLLWDLDNLKPLHSTLLPGPLVTGLAFSPDGQRIFCGGSGDLSVLDGKVLAILHRVPVPSRIRNLSLSPDGKLLVTCGLDLKAQVWDAQSLQVLFDLIHDNKAFDAVFAADNRTIYSCDHATVYTWELPDRKNLVANPPPGPKPLPGPKDPPKPPSATLPRPQLVVLSTSQNDLGTNYVLSITNWAAYPDELFRPAPDLPPVANNKDAPRTILNILDDGLPVKAYQFSKPGDLERFQISVPKDQPLPKGIAVALLDRRMAKSYQSETIALLQPRPNPEGPPIKELTFVKYKADMGLCSLRLLVNERVLMLGGSRVLLWDIPTRKTLIPPVTGNKAGSLRAALAIAPNGVFAATSIVEEKEIYLWNLELKQPLGSLKGHGGLVNQLAFLPDSFKLLSAGEDKEVRLWDLRTRQILKQFKGHTAAVHGLDISPDGRRAISCSLDGDIRLWDLANLTLIQNARLPDPSLRAVAFTPDGTRILCGGSKTLTLLDAETLAILRTVPASKGVRRLSFSPDGKYFVSCGSGPQASVWDGKRLRELYHLTHTYQAMEAIFAGDGQTIYSCDVDGIYFWQLPK